MSISSELLTLQNTKTAIRTAINNKGGSVGASDTFSSYATAIDNLPSGGSGNPLLTSIDVSDFTGTTFNSATSYITGATIPNGVTTIGDNVFSSFTSLSSVNIPNGVTVIGMNAFSNTGLTGTLIIPNSVTTIKRSAFDGCMSLTSIEIGTGVTSIQSISQANGAFANCTSLTSIICKATTPPTLGHNNVFSNTNNCPIYVPAESVEAYKTANNWSTYASRIVAIEDAILFTPTNGDPTISVKNYQLASSNYVQSSDVPSTIKNGAGSLEIGEGVTRIGTFVFQNGSSLTSVTIPSTITRIDNAAFDGCSSLTSITVNATTPPTLYAAAFDHTNDCPIYVPAESVETYQAASGWSTYASRIEAIQEPVEEYPLVLPDTATISLSNDVDAESLEARIPISIYYSNGADLQCPVTNSSGVGDYFDPLTEGQCSAYLSDGVTDVSDYFGFESTENGYELIMYFSDDEETLVDWAVSGEEVTLNLTFILPDSYYEVEEGVWDVMNYGEERTGTMTITLDT